ncbi:MAG: EAL domain-containing protein [Thermodesulfobacteriota bacterium]
MDDVVSDKAQRALVQAMVSVAHSLNMAVVAEGVASEEQRQVLCELNCDGWQGFLLSPAVPPEQFAVMLRSDTTRRL